MAIRVPRLSYEDLRGFADRFLAERHPSGTIPIPIEEIVEFELGINIIPLPGLHADHGIDGFLSADMTEISVLGHRAVAEGRGGGGWVATPGHRKVGAVRRGAGVTWT